MPVLAASCIDHRYQVNDSNKISLTPVRRDCRQHRHAATSRMRRRARVRSEDLFSSIGSRSEYLPEGSRCSFAKTWRVHRNPE